VRHDLENAGMTVVVMEATGDYWKPFFFLLAETLNVELLNAKQARNDPGRKTNVSDAVWLAELAAHGLLRASFLRPGEIRKLRDLPAPGTTSSTNARASMPVWKKDWKAPTSNCPPSPTTWARSHPGQFWTACCRRK
jgi:hypothetical protein